MDLMLSGILALLLGLSGAAAEQGQVKPATPAEQMYYVIDHRGEIRYKWSGYPGEKAIDTALEKLIQEAERTGSKSPK